jgi:putative FmdB family regulatory protein
MPIYEYRCNDCAQVSEFIVLGAEEGLACKACGSPKLEKLMSAHNTIGSGGGGGFSMPSGGCCGSPNSCGTPGSCCSG